MWETEIKNNSVRMDVTFDRDVQLMWFLCQKISSVMLALLHKLLKWVILWSVVVTETTLSVYCQAFSYYIHSIWPIFAVLAQYKPNPPLTSCHMAFNTISRSLISAIVEVEQRHHLMVTGWINCENWLLVAMAYPVPLRRDINFIAKKSNYWITRYQYSSY